MSFADKAALFSAILAGLALIVSVFALIVSWLHKRDGAHSADAAVRSAKAAEESADIAARGERAWVILSEARSLSNFQAERLTLRVRVTLTNNGKTPALSLRTWRKAELRTTSPQSQDCPVVLSGDSGTLGPGNSCQLDLAGLDPTTQEFSDIMSNRRTLFVYGVAEYEDIIFKKKDNRTYWCLRFVPASKEFAISDMDKSVT
jgi:hypothetical protein